MGMGCSSCHQILDTSDTSGTRKTHVEQPTGGTIQANYKARYNLSLSLQGTDLGSSYGNPTLGVCYFCHGGYIKHQGDGTDVTSGCQDCHDEHAEGAGAGANYFMIPPTSKPTGTYLVTPAKTRSGLEAVTYDSPRRDPATGTEYSDSSIDFYRADNAGTCDNQECHGLAGGPGALSTLMAAGTGTHSGSVPQAAGSDCGFCHEHNEPTGGWRAGGSCSNSEDRLSRDGRGERLPGRVAGVVSGPWRQAQRARAADRGGERAERAEYADVRFCHPGGTHSGDIVTPAEMNDGTAGKEFRTINDVIDVGAGWRGERGELFEHRLSLRHDGDDRGLVQRIAGGELHVLPPDGRGVQRVGESAAERAHGARGRGSGRRLQLQRARSATRTTGRRTGTRTGW